ncbi:MAG TPA: hypothetical protein VEK39_05970 [Solirubrobacterales bacterium]|nr:hypothetical protein [Solirubrobacterales bacterium]
MSDVGAPRFARPFVAVYLVAFVICALTTIEAWPLTAWRLFSHLRTENQLSWSATAIDRQGGEHPYPLGALPQGYRGFGFLMSEFTTGSPERQRELCDTWREGTGELLGFESRAVRIYELRTNLAQRDGDRAEPAERELRYTCRAGGVDAAGG